MDWLRADDPPGWPAGRLEGVDLHELIWGLCSRARTGLLHVRNRHVLRRLYVQDGRVLFVTSSSPDDRLGEMLLRQRKITLDQLEAALRLQSTGKRLGTLLVESGSLTSSELVEAVVHQIRTIVLDTLAWERGEYWFEERALPTMEAITLETATAELVLASVRSIDSLRRIEHGVGPTHTVYHPSEQPAGDAADPTLGEGERLVLERLRREPASVETLCSELPLASYEVFRTVWALAILEIVRAEEHPPPPADQPRGRLDGMEFAELLRDLAQAEETGVLFLYRRAVERRIHLRDGRCVFATSSEPDDGLVTYLFRRGVISQKDRDEVSRRLLSNKRVGTILRELGVIDDDDLQQAVRRHAGEIVFDSFGWSDGDFVFVRGELPSVEEIPLDLGIAELIPEGLRRIDSWTQVIRGCGGVDEPLTLAPGHLSLLAEMDAGAEEQQVVDALDTPQSPRRLCRVLELPDFRVCQILWTLRLLGAIESRPIDDLLDGEELEPPVATEGEEQFTEAPVVAAGTQQDLATALRELPERVYRGETSEDRPDPPSVEATTDEPEPEELSELDQVIQRFNAMHRVIYRVARSEIGAGAINFVRSCCVEVAQGAPDALEGVQLRSDGSWDESALKQVARDKQIEDPWPVYRMLLDHEYLQLKSQLGDAKAAALKQRIWELHQSDGRA